MSATKLILQSQHYPITKTNGHITQKENCKSIFLKNPQKTVLAAQ